MNVEYKSFKTTDAHVFGNKIKRNKLKEIIPKCGSIISMKSWRCGLRNEFIVHLEVSRNTNLDSAKGYENWNVINERVSKFD